MRVMTGQEEEGGATTKNTNTAVQGGIWRIHHTRQRRGPPPQLTEESGGADEDVGRVRERLLRHPPVGPVPVHSLHTAARHLPAGGAVGVLQDILRHGEHLHHQLLVGYHDNRGGVLEASLRAAAIHVRVLGRSEVLLQNGQQVRQCLARPGFSTDHHVFLGNQRSKRSFLDDGGDGLLCLRESNREV